MNLDFSRRDILFAATGSAVGIALSPLPWKLLGDSAIWTQRSRFAPEPLRGDVTTRLSACTLCPAGCALRARCIGGRPVSMAPVAGHPVSRGALCATGFALHHLPAHPLRLKGPAQITPRSGGVDAVAKGADVAVAAVADAVRKVRSAGAAVPVAFLDLRPGRAASLENRRLLALLPGAVQLAGPSHQGGTLDALRTRLEETAPLGVDLERPRTIVSFGTPLLEGWGTPGTVPLLVSRRNTGSLRLVQVEARRSPTAEGADQWLPIRPGTDAALALGLAHLLLAEGLVPREAGLRARDLEGENGFRSFIAPFDPAAVERITGVAAADLKTLAHQLASTPSLAIGGGAPGREPLGREEEAAIAALNLLLGNGGPGGSLVSRREVPAPEVPGLAPVRPLAETADGSIGVLIVDGSGDLAWPLVASKLAPNAVVVSLSPWLAGPALHASWAIPAPAPLEALEELLPPTGATTASWGLAPALVAPPSGAMAPAAFLAKLGAALGTPAVEPEPAEKLLKSRAAAIAASGRGQLVVAGSAPVAVAEAGGGDGLYDKVLAGATWVDSPLPPPKDAPRFTLLPSSRPEIAALASVASLGRADRQGEKPSGAPDGYVGESGSLPAPALLAKLGRESLLRPSNPARRFTPVTIREA